MGWFRINHSQNQQQIVVEHLLQGAGMTGFNLVYLDQFGLLVELSFRQENWMEKQVIPYLDVGISLLCEGSQFCSFSSAQPLLLCQKKMATSPDQTFQESKGGILRIEHDGQVAVLGE
jgi:hypothetical protein